MLSLLPGKDVGSDELPTMTSKAAHVLGRVVTSCLGARNIDAFAKTPKKVGARGRGGAAGHTPGNGRHAGSEEGCVRGGEGPG